MKKIICFVALCLLLTPGFAKNYYCDPLRGAMKNDGSAKFPWSRLDSVFLMGKKISSGDTIFLRTGFHGSPIISGNLYTNGSITVIAQKGNFPTVKAIEFVSAKNWLISGLTISPEATGVHEKGDFVAIRETASEISLESCTIYSTDSCINDWSVTKLLNGFGLGIRVEGKNCNIRNNVIKQVAFGISVGKTATNTNVSHNIIYGFLNDGIRGLSDNSVYEYNTIAGSYGVDDNHDDAFQSWSTDEKGKVGMGKVTNVTLRGNLMISQIDPNQPFPQQRGMQGIGNFDGFFDHWLVEDNLIFTNMWHGISFYGATNCTIRNNTVLQNPLNKMPYIPWIAIYDHKNKTVSRDNAIINNITSKIAESKGVVTLINNIDISQEHYDSFFKNWKAFDGSLKSGTKNPEIGIRYLKAMMIDLKKLNRCQ